MFTRKTMGWFATGLALVGAAFGTQLAKADEPIVRHAVITSDDQGSVELIRHGWRRGWRGGYGYYGPRRWGGYYRPYRVHPGYGYWSPGYGYGYPAYGYPRSGYGYGYGNPGFGVYVW